MLLVSQSPLTLALLPLPQDGSRLDVTAASKAGTGGVSNAWFVDMSGPTILVATSALSSSLPVPSVVNPTLVCSCALCRRLTVAVP